MKKLLLVFLTTVLVLTACSSEGLTQVKPTAITQKFEKNESFIVYLGLSYCSACKIFRSIVDSVIKSDGITVYYVEYDKENEKDLAELVPLLEQNEVFSYTFPIIYIVNEGKIIDQFSLEQTEDETAFKARLEKNGILE